MKNQKFGAISLFTAAGFYGLYGIFSRLIGTSFGSFSQNWVRNLIVLALIAGVIVIRKTKLLAIRKEDLKWIILWLLSGSWVTVLTFIAFNNLQIGTTYLIIYSSMIAAGFISGKIFFKEKLNISKTASLVLCFLGLVIIYRFSISSNEVIYVILAFTSGFMTGVWNTISKKFSDHYSNNQIVMMDAAGGVIAALIGSMLFKEKLPMESSSVKWFWIFVYALVQTVNVGLIVYGFKNIEAQVGSIILPVEIIFATLFSYFVFKEYPQPATYLGGLLIISAAILPNINAVLYRRT
ncbi:MAG: hypothetical protein UT24_C0009G0070 [Candidatus Woesebacteria bacterium GW2011_GWB1_39_12]|uniref:EamA domain-containing protein n=2 Tax=Candidatus Woeseibacteriota TaxID=1752722 RepID=A0A0G0ME16_9BACT|nr:MAG: hypothetical protein UT23_C0002G0070 [Candidatus Woesebacteria bacterium GW2011_GWA1_39_12]KKR00753.1 MAG: hypothetical protein UT24_C0009G0070 [Candidatus Woesebacteria bacterium GW2011_GWB1_39_12]